MATWTRTLASTCRNRFLRTWTARVARTDLTLKIADANFRGRHGPNQGALARLSKLTKLLPCAIFDAGEPYGTQHATQTFLGEKVT